MTIDCVSMRFLFQIGTIKTLMFEKVVYRLGKFLFQIGTIKTLSYMSKLTRQQKVSIPNWYD